MPAPATEAGVERRQNPALRQIFPDACALLAPLLASSKGYFSVSSFSLMHILQEHYPDLSATEAHVMVTAMERLQREGALREIVPR